MNKKVFKINLNLNLTSNLRDKILENENYSHQKTMHIPKTKEKEAFDERAWNRICAIMDRLDDTAYYLNKLEIKNDGERRGAFCFYDFMNNAEVLIECINILGRIYNFDFSEINKATSVFNNFGNDGKGTDIEYFKYLRSLCSVHPVCTNNHKSFMDENTRSECSPFVYWTEDFCFSSDEGYDLSAVVYTDSGDYKYVNIRIEEVFLFVKRRFDLISQIIFKIEEYNIERTSDLKNTLIKKENEFSSYVEYLKYLKEEYKKRIGNYNTYYFDFFIYAFSNDFEEEKNQTAIKKYKNAIKLSICFFHSYLQDLPETDLPEYSGLKEQPENTTGDCLMFHLHDVPAIEAVNLPSGRYSFNNLCELFDSDRNEYLKRGLYNTIKELIDPYVQIDIDNMENRKIGFLVQVAIYFINLEFDKILNENIPNTEEYRLRIK